jgi:hypothetical protein
VKRNELYQKVISDETNHALSAPRSATALSLMCDNLAVIRPPPQNIDPTSVSFREMLWRKAGSHFNDGLYDGPTLRLSVMRTAAYDEGWKTLKQEFKSYADRDDWEAIELLQRKQQTLGSLMINKDLQ